MSEQNKKQKFILWFKEISSKDVPLVGGKNASLGEMISQLTARGILIPNGFALTTNAYWYFLKENKIDGELKKIFDPIRKSKISNGARKFDPKSIKSLQETGKAARKIILKAEFPEDLKNEIIKAYQELSKKYNLEDADVAVRTSGVAEDQPTMSFAGQFETFLNVRGEDNLLKAIKKCVASTFTDRAIAYREEKKISQLKFGLSIGIQKIVRSDSASSGIIFTLDTETGFQNVILINSIFGVGEMIVKGRIIPDQFYVFKPTLKQGFKPIIVKNLGKKTKKYIYKVGGGLKEVGVCPKDQLRFSLTDEEILTLAKWACLIEDHYKFPQDIEWAKDGKLNQLFIVQSRPETVHAPKEVRFYQECEIKTEKKPILTGIAIGNKIGTGKVRIIPNVSKIGKFKKGEVLVTRMTDPDWVAAFPLASGIVTDEGGKTCFSEDTKVLTNKGFLSIKEIVEKYKIQKIKVLSLNRKSLKLEWEKVINSFQRKAPLIQIEISQTGRMKNNVLKVTSDHKFLTFVNRKLFSEEIQNIIRDEKRILSVSKISSPSSLNFSSKLAYLLGAISTDGHICLDKRHAQIFFIQKPTKVKKAFIGKVKKYFFDEYKYKLHLLEKPATEGIIRGKKIKGGKSIALKCYIKEIAKDLLRNQKNISNILLVASDEFVFNFLAGVIDGDGTYNKRENKINIFCSKDELFKAISIACLRLGINFQVSLNRTIYNIQIVDKVEEIFRYTARVKGEYRRERFGTRFFAAKQLLGDIIEKVNYKGRIRLYIKNNLLIDAEKIRNYIIPLIKGEPINHSLSKIINSPLKMLRVDFKNSLGVKDVYNIETENNHNYVVFTNRCTPVVVENCHAAIVSRELGIPCITGTERATKILKTDEVVTVDCTSGSEGRIFLGKIPFKIKRYDLKKIPKLKTKIMINIGAPEIAFQTSFLPTDGVGLARIEFILAEKVRVHPLALYHFRKLKNKTLKRKIEQITVEHKDKKEHFIKELAEGIAQIAAAFYPKEVIVRFSDFKTNEYRNLIGGELFEKEEANPMLGFRGACRYVDKNFQPAFEMECQVIKRTREEFGLKNVSVMIPFCRTVEEGRAVINLMKKFGLEQHKDNLKVYVMCEIPSNVVLAEKFLEVFDGMSIGSNDLTQLAMGMDRDNAKISYIADERDATIKEMIKKVIETCKLKKKYCGICGQAPSDIPEFAEFLVEQGIESISLNPDTVIKTILKVAKKEQRLSKGRI